MGVESVNMRINGMGLNGAAGDISVAVPTTVTTVAEAAAAINTGIAANAAVAATGVQAVVNGTKIDLVNAAGNSFTAQTAGDVSNSLGFGSWSNSAGAAGGTGTFGYDALTAIGVSNAATQNLQISINGGAATADLGPLTGTGVESTDIATLNAAFQGNATTRAAGMEAVDNGFGKIEITSSSGDNFRAQLLWRNRRCLRVRSQRHRRRPFNRGRDQQLRGRGQHQLPGRATERERQRHRRL